MKSILRLFSTLFLSAIILVSCSKINPSSRPIAAFLVVHASPDAPPLDVYVGNSLINSSQTYGKDSGYFGAEANVYDFKFIDAVTNNILVENFVNLDGGKGYSIFVVDSLSNLKLSVANDEFSAPVGDSIRIRFLHFSPNTGALDVTTNSNDTLYLNRNFKDQELITSYNNFITLPSGAYSINLLDAGTTDTAYFLPAQNFVAGNVYTLYAKGFRGSVDSQKTLGIGLIKNTKP